MSAPIAHEAGSTFDPDYSTSQVPLEARSSRLSLSMSWWGLCSAMFWLVVTASLALNFGAVNAIVGVLASTVIYGLICAVFARFAIRSGLSVTLFSKWIFGKLGGNLATVILFATAIYYAVFEGSIIAVALKAYIGNMELWHAYLIVVIYSAPLVFGGITQWIDKLNGVLLPLYIIGLLAAVLFAVSGHGYDSRWIEYGAGGSTLDSRVWDVITYYMGVFVVMMFTFDYARFGRPEDEDYHARLAFGIPFWLFTLAFNGIIGIFLVATIPTEGELSETNVVFALLELMGIWGLLLIIVSQTRINTANFQVAVVNIQAFTRLALKVDISKVITAVVVGIAVFALMLTNVFSFLFQALAYQSIFIVAWVVIALVHILYIHRDQSLPDFGSFQDSLPNYNMTGLLAWLFGTGVGITLMQLQVASSMVAPATALVAGVIYATAARRQ